MEAMAESDAALKFEVFTTVPRWLFEDSLSAPFHYHALQTDIGLVQTTAFQIDLDKTLQRLDAFYPIIPGRIGKISDTIKQLKCTAIICDIAPLGILVAKATGLPSILVENFTWDWIYREYAFTHRRFQAHIDYLQQVFDTADYRIQAEPACSDASADLKTAPVCRKIKASAGEIKKRLGLPPAEKMVMITTGGIPSRYGFLEKLISRAEIRFIIPGIVEKVQIRRNLILLPHRSEFYHPDLVNAADAVVGKVGYSTLAEIFHAGVPFGYIARENYRESGKMVEFVEKEMIGIAVEDKAFEDGSWISGIDALLALERRRPNLINGARQAARFIGEILL